MLNRHLPVVSARLASQPKRRTSLAVISGATSQMGPRVADALSEQGYSVVCLSGRKEVSINLSRHRTVCLDRERMDSREYVAEHLEPAFKSVGQIDRVAVINLVGSPRGDLDRVNVAIPQAAIEATEQLAEACSASRFAIGQISSIAATINGPDCRYAEAKRKIDEWIRGHSNSDAAIVLRPGIIMPRPQGSTLDMGHRFSPNEMSTLPVNVFLGSGNQIMQPVSQDCLIEALTRGIQGADHSVVDAVGREAITLKEFIEFFRQRSKKPAFANISVPYSLGAFVGKHMGQGRMQEYAVRLLFELDRKPEPLCSRSFEGLLGREPLKIEDLYSAPDLSSPKPRIIEYTRESLRGLFRNKEAQRDLFRLITTGLI